MKILQDENEFAVNKIYGLKSVAVMIIALLLVSYVLIGGCNNNSSTQMADALQIGELSGPIVPAVDAEFFIRDWQEGDSNNNFRIACIESPLGAFQFHLWLYSLCIATLVARRIRCKDNKSQVFQTVKFLFLFHLLFFVKTSYLP